MTNRNLISCFVNSQYETLSNWLSSTLYDEHFLPLLKERYITYYVQNFLIPSIFDFTLKNTANPGGIVEIGCAEGYLSEILSSTAKNNKVDYVAIDPWNGQQEGDESKYQSFLKKIEKNKDSTFVYRQSSQNRETLDIFNKHKASVAYVDGLHYTEAAYEDILTCVNSNNCELICVDDLIFGRNDYVQAAFDRAVNEKLIEPVRIVNKDAYAKVTEFKEYQFAFVNKK